MLELLPIGEINVVYVEVVLTFIIEIPLIDNFKFVMYKSIPLPIKIHDNICIIIEPTSDYVAIDKSRLHYIKLSSQQLSNCKTITNTILFVTTINLFKM